jgi:hypothetical protein
LRFLGIKISGFWNKNLRFLGIEVSGLGVSEFLRFSDFRGFKVLILVGFSHLESLTPGNHENPKPQKLNST